MVHETTETTERFNADSPRPGGTKPGRCGAEHRGQRGWGGDRGGEGGDGSRSRDGPHGAFSAPARALQASAGGDAGAGRGAGTVSGGTASS